ncbi:MAG: phenylacetic acid degradation protein PaaN [Actinomycetota bacterium]|nr:phenylacetic acid degradation protein PaaN [Actinomycetota bacterium]
MAALAARGYFSRYPESPSPRVYGEGAAEDGRQAFDAHLTKHFAALAGQAGHSGHGAWVGAEVSPYGPLLRVGYPQVDVDRLLAAAQDAMPVWRSVGPEVRAAVCVEIIDRINARSFEIASAVMHTSGQPFVMAFQAGGPHAQDRALEAVVAALAEQLRIPATVRWEKPGRAEPIVMEKDNHIVGRGVAVVIGCNTFPTWNAYPGLFASLATGNAVVVKPHPHAILPLAITVEIAREVLSENGFDPDLVTLAAEEPGGTLAKALIEHPAVKVVDYTGGPAFGAWLEAEGARRGVSVFTEKAGVNTVVVDSTDDLDGMLANLAFSFTLYSGQMCTTPQNVYVPRDGISTEAGPLSFADFGARLAAAIGTLTAQDAKAVELLGATVNDGVRERAASVASLAGSASSGTGRVVLDSREVEHPMYPDAVVRSPALVAVDVSDQEVYRQECFGPVAFLIATDSTAESLRTFVDTVRVHGAMTAAVYSTSAEVLDDARDAAVDAGVHLSENLTGQVFVNQTAAFSDYHGTGANPAANAAYVDAAYVAPRFRVITTRRHIQPA